MACISCGVMTSAWLCRNSSFWVSAMVELRYFAAELLGPEVTGPVVPTPVRRSLLAVRMPRPGAAGSSLGNCQNHIRHPNTQCTAGPAPAPFAQLFLHRKVFIPGGGQESHQFVGSVADDQ